MAKHQRFFERTGNRTAFEMESVVENIEPVKKEDLTAPARTKTASVVYRRLEIERPDLKILTPESEYLHIKQKIRYLCTLCGTEGEARKDRLLPKKAGGWDPFRCKGCEGKIKKDIVEEWLWQRTLYYVKGFNGSIVKYTKQGEYSTNTDLLQLRCEHGHEWVLPHKRLHEGEWCPQCKAMGLEKEPPPKFPNLRRSPTPEIKFSTLMYAMSRFGGMRLEFPIIERSAKSKYFATCMSCGQTTILNEDQIYNRQYLCFNRCCPSNITSLTAGQIELGFMIGDIEENFKQMSVTYEEAKKKYYAWKSGGLNLPEPVVSKKKIKKT
jgi:hypothetical protein